MACKYYQEYFGQAWCKAGTKEVKRDYDIEKKYCKDDAWCTKCPHYK